MNQVLRNLASAILLIVALSSLVSLLSSRREIPSGLEPFGSEKLLFQVRAKGDQIYVCQEESSCSANILPDLPWEARDGSRVTGKAVASVDWNDPRSVPWLLIDVVSHEHSGVLSHVTTIPCLYTRGGVAPIFGCNGSHAAREVRVPHSADYLFYAPK
jgi:hypothetical protein